MLSPLRLRTSEWVLLTFFFYVAMVSIWFHPLSTLPWLPLWIFPVVLGVVCSLAAGEVKARGPCKEVFS